MVQYPPYDSKDLTLLVNYFNGVGLNNKEIARLIDVKFLIKLDERQQAISGGKYLLTNHARHRLKSLKSRLNKD